MKNIILTLFIALFSASLLASDIPLINISAEGQVKTKADMANIQLSIQAIELDANQARSKADEQVKRLLSQLKKFTLKEGSLDSSHTSIHQQYDYSAQPRKLLGYQASRQVSFELSDLKQLESLIKAVSQLEYTSLNNIQFSVKDERYWEDSALSNALQLAKAKAEIIAQEMGVELAGLYRVNHQVNRSGRPGLMRSMMATEMDKSSNETYEQKDIDLSAFVEVSFKFN